LTERLLNRELKALKKEYPKPTKPKVVDTSTKPEKEVKGVIKYPPREMNIHGHIFLYMNTHFPHLIYNPQPVDYDKLMKATLHHYLERLRYIHIIIFAVVTILPPKPDEETLLIIKSLCLNTAYILLALAIPLAGVGHVIVAYLYNKYYGGVEVKFTVDRFVIIKSQLLVLKLLFL
jgi:hypothetical protein